jgi:hypothetical protein
MAFINGALLTIVKCSRARDVVRYWSREETALSEYVQFAGVMILFIAILIGSYWFVLYSPCSPGREQKERQSERARG